MIRAYNEMYLYDGMKNLGEAFDYAINSCGIEPDEFMELFIASGIADAFGNGNPGYICGRSGTELVLDVFLKTGFPAVLRSPQTEYDCSPEYWCGWILAYYQWKSGRNFRNIYAGIKISDILKMYPTLHEASEDKAVDLFDNIFHRRKHVTKLQEQRKQCGYTQKELSEKSGVNLRTLQQYEIGTKDIVKASLDTVIALSNVLGCKIDAILE